MPIPIERILFVDIETVPAYESLDKVDEPLREYWLERYDPHRPKDLSELSPEDYFLEKSGIHPLYAQVVCIGLGYFIPSGTQWRWRDIVIYDLDERKLLSEFIEKWENFRSYALRGVYTQSHEPLWGVCGHNIRRFDLPFLGRRLLMQGLGLPEFWYAAQYSQPWQLKDPTVLDTMQLWGFASDEKPFIPLEMLARALGIPFQKSLTHTDIRKAFHSWKATENKTLFQPVLAYCRQDVRITAEIYIRMQVYANRQESLLEALKNPEEQEYEPSHS